MSRLIPFAVCVLCLCSVSNVALAAYPDEVLADNPVAYYRFEETSGPPANDSSAGGTNDGTYMNGVLLNQTGVSSETGLAAGFDGSDDYVETPNTVGGDFTLEAWINTTDDSPGGTHAYDGNGILWSDVTGDDDDFVVAVLDDRLAFTTGNPDETVTGGPLLNDGRWHHIVAVREQGVGVSVYVDGNLIGTGSTNNNSLTANSEIHIGGNTLDERFFDGRIDEVAYYTSVLGADRVAAHYDAAALPAVALPADVPTLNGWAMLLLSLSLGAAAWLTIRR